MTIRMVPRNVRGRTVYDVTEGIKAYGTIETDKKGRKVASRRNGETAMFRSDGEAIAWTAGRMPVWLEVEFFEIVYDDGERVQHDTYESADKAAIGTADLIEKWCECIHLRTGEATYLKTGRYYALKEGRGLKGKAKAEAIQRRQNDDIERRRTTPQAKTGAPV